MLSDLNAVILAGGLGTRLRPVLWDQPKVLAPIGGRPFLAYLLDELVRQGARRVVLCTGHLGEQVEARFGNAYGPLSLVYSQEHEPRGTGGAIRGALPLLESDPALILNGDSYCRVHLPTFLAWHRARKARGSLVIARVAERSRYGRVDVSDDGAVLLFREKEDKGGSGWVCVGVYLLSQEIIASMPADGPCSLERDVLPAAAGLFGYRIEGPFLDIGTPESYAQANGSLKQMTAAAHDSGKPLFRGHTVLLDRDGTLNVERHYLSDPDRVELLPGVIDGLRRLQALGFRLVVVSNQSAVGRGCMDEGRLAAVHARLRALLGEAGVELAGIYACPHQPEDGCRCRKPEPGLVEQAAADLGFDPGSTIVVGDKACDIDLARRIGATAILVTTGYGRETVANSAVRADFVVDNLGSAAEVIGHVAQDLSPWTLPETID